MDLAIDRLAHEEISRWQTILVKEYDGQAALFLLKKLLQELRSLQRITFAELWSDQEDSCCFINAHRLAKSLLTKSWEELHIGVWSDVPQVWREIYAFVSLVFVCTDVSRDIEEASRLLDLAVLLGTGSWKEDILICLEYLDSVRTGCEFLGSEAKVQPQLSRLVTDDCAPPSDLVTYPLPKRHRPSLETFFNQYLSPQIPVVIKGVATEWSCVKDKRWNDIVYWKQVAGNRLVPIEVGSSYMSEDWSQQLTKLGEFIDQYIIQTTSRIGYLAQHPLLEQVPSLMKDIQIPEYCYLSETNSLPRIHIWFGPKNTRTPLHYDAQHNLFVQVVGWKYIRLYAPRESSKLYPSEGTLHKNTSLIDDIEQVDTEKYPNFMDAVYQECVVGSGDMLYIPPGYWHYVKALDKSISLSFWWT
ncbi:transcription factor jumonji (jmjC) domain-containing protein [Galdieria sulphuraria]|uniref:JmjC domain-containing protein 5 n=1 Tax=Galdieria sulphuraria TaxID=130081 RepID=M2W781_GALSU|nr:transcription factor jumonji (jmjC) domain-containing protein [Galdieria sulphuraria]EME31676.1 transcription factor jumonji (jmjC) domain-containing protein [Galdieria sulphuraria]|eukprot:XP_005708196.1 transcription factor jumonji (jmjC) domain-containing protein [Galdieria sulphuraria]